jgi:hypothetical protein
LPFPEKGDKLDLCVRSKFKKRLGWKHGNTPRRFLMGIKIFLSPIISKIVEIFHKTLSEHTAISNHIRYILVPSSLAGRGLGVGFLF